MSQGEGHTVVIVGLSPTSRNLVADEPDGIEIWGLNHAHAVFSPQVLSKFTRWFQIHPYQEMAARQLEEHKHLEWLAQAKIPVYLDEVRPEVPTSVAYPRAEVLRFLKMEDMDYLTSTVSYMLALALMEGFRTVRLLGIDLSTKEEYIRERPNFEFLLGIAHHLEVQIELPAGCPILQGAPYAKPAGISYDRIGDHLRKMRGKRDKAMAEYNFFQGAIRLAETMMLEANHGDLREVVPGDTFKAEINPMNTDGFVAKPIEELADV